MFDYLCWIKNTPILMDIERILHEYSYFIEIIKRVEEKR